MKFVVVMSVHCAIYFHPTQISCHYHVFQEKHFLLLCQVFNGNNISFQSKLRCFSPLFLLFKAFCLKGKWLFLPFPFCTFIVLSILYRTFGSTKSSLLPHAFCVNRKLICTCFDNSIQFIYALLFLNKCGVKVLASIQPNIHSN